MSAYRGTGLEKLVRRVLSDMSNPSLLRQGAVSSARYRVALMLASVFMDLLRQDLSLPKSPYFKSSEKRRASHVGETAQTTEVTGETVISGLLGRTRSFLKVQDGCSQNAPIASFHRCAVRVEASRLGLQSRELDIWWGKGSLKSY